MTIAPTKEPMILSVDGVKYQYGSVPALRGLNLQIRRGERIALLGANGSGKSTLLRLLDGLLFAQEGAVYFGGEALTEESLNNDNFCFNFRRRVALLFQDSDAQLFNPTVFDEVAFGPVQLGWSRDRVAARVEAELEAMRLAHLRDRPPYQLSGGEKKRVALACILVLEPEVLLLDEPTGAMDPRSQEEFLELVSKRPPGSTLITATHDLELTRHIAGRCCVMYEGTVVAEGSVEAILGDRVLLERTNLLSTFRKELRA